MAKPKLCKWCKEREATEGQNGKVDECFDCWEEIHCLMTDALREFADVAYNMPE